MKVFRSPCLVLLLALAPMVKVQADQNDPRLDDLFARLQTLEDPGEAAVVEQQIWQIWVEHDNPAFAELMTAGIRYMNQNQNALALDTFTKLIAMAPEWAEAWNKRATMHWVMGNLPASEADIVETLRLEPFHFGALSGRGLVALSRNDLEAAYRAFQRVLEVYPAMDGVRDTLLQLERQLGVQAI